MNDLFRRNCLPVILLEIKTLLILVAITQLSSHLAIDLHLQKQQKYKGHRKVSLSKTNFATNKKIANLISKLNFYRLIPYPMDNMLNRSAQTGPPNVRKRRPVFPPAGRSSHCALARWRIVLPCCLDNLTSWHLFHCLKHNKPLVN